MLKNVSSCIHAQRIGRGEPGTPLLNRCDGNGLHISLISGPRERRVRKAKYLRTQVVCGFTYVKADSRGYVTLLVDPRKPLLLRYQLDDAIDQFVELIVSHSNIGGVYGLDGSGQLVSAET